MKTLIAVLLTCQLAACQTQPASPSAARHVPVLVNGAGATIGQIAPSSSEYHTASVVLRDKGHDLIVGVGAHRSLDTGKALSTGLTWGLGWRSFAEPNCAGQEYIAVGGGTSAVGERLTLVYREAGKYTLAVGKRSIGNISRRQLASFMDQSGACKTSPAALLSAEIERTTPLERYGEPPFFLK